MQGFASDTDYGDSTSFNSSATYQLPVNTLIGVGLEAFAVNIDQSKGVLTNESQATASVSIAPALPPGYSLVFSTGLPSPPLQITTTNLPHASSSVSYSTKLAATGGSGTGYTWSVASGTLPAGFTLSPAGVLSSAGNQILPPATAYSFTVMVTDSAGNHGNSAIDIGHPVSGTRELGRRSVRT